MSKICTEYNFRKYVERLSYKIRLFDYMRFGGRGKRKREDFIMIRKEVSLGETMYLVFIYCNVSFVVGMGFLGGGVCMDFEV